MLSILPPHISLANTPTPMRAFERTELWVPTTHTLPKVWLKSDDQSGFVLGGNKVRKLEFLLADALSQNANVIVTCGGIQSNHCRATAFACAQLGIQCHLILRDDRGFQGESSLHQANHFLDQLSGATYSLHSPGQYQKDLSALFEAALSMFSEEGKKGYSIPVGGSNEVGIWGYVSAANEIVEQCTQHGIHPDVVVCASGSGGTQAGLSLGMHCIDPSISVIGVAVCDSAEYFQEKARSDIQACKERYQLDIDVADVGIMTIDDYIGTGYALASPDIYETISKLAQCEGIVLDPVYTAKAMYGMIQELKAGTFNSAENIIFVHTGGAFGLFPHSRAFYDDTLTQIT